VPTGHECHLYPQKDDKYDNAFEMSFNSSFNMPFIILLHVKLK